MNDSGTGAGRPISPHEGAVDADFISVDTPAMRQAMRLVEDHLFAHSNDGEVPVPGDVVIVAGEPGTGKSHLIERILRRCRSVNETTDASVRKVRAIRLDISIIEFDQLHRRFVDALPRDEVVACVREYHTDLVTALITDAEVATRARELLRAPGLSARDRDDLVAQLGLSPSALLEQLRPALIRVVGDADYATALTLLLRDGLEDAAWEWLRGESPAVVLQERGLSSAAVADLTGVVVFGQLYGRQERPLLVLIDDVDVLVSSQDGGRQVRAFRRMLEELRAAGTLIVVTGRPGPLDRLGLDRSGRAGARIMITGFDASNTESFLRSSSPSGTVHPFDAGAIDRLVDLTAGNPFMVRELTELLRRSARQSGQTVAADTVLTEARRYFSITDRSRVTSAVRRVLERHSWDLRANYVVGVEPRMEVDFWIQVIPDVAGCAIIITEAVVDSDDVERLSAIAHKLDEAAQRSPALVVMTGAVSTFHVARIQQAFGREPLVYTADSFEADLAVAVKAMVHALDSAGENPLAGVRDRISHLDRQQSLTYDLLGRVELTVQALVSDVRTIRVSNAITTGTGVAAYGADRATPIVRVRALIERALRSVADLGSAKSAVAGVFGTDGAGTDAMVALRRILFEGEVSLPALGSAAVMVAAVEEFGGAVEAWLSSVPPPDDDQFGVRESRELEVICSRYSDVLDVLPWTELTNLTGAISAPSTMKPSLDPARRRDRATRLLRSLHNDVRDAVLDPSGR